MSVPSLMPALLPMTLSWEEVDDDDDAAAAADDDEYADDKR